MKPVKTFVFWLVIVFSAYLLWQVVKTGGNEQKIPEISYSEFLSQIEAGKVSKVTISKQQVIGRYGNNGSFRVTAPAAPDAMLQALRQKNVEIWFRDEAEGSWPTWLLNIAPLILLAALWFFMIRQLKQRRVQS